MDLRHLELAGLTEDEALDRARQHQKRMADRGYPIDLQEAVMNVIDAAIEHNQG